MRGKLKPPPAFLSPTRKYHPLIPPSISSAMTISDVALIMPMHGMASFINLRKASCVTFRLLGSPSE
jgi:hypothetical protein